jgi:hypothetical protein
MAHVVGERHFSGEPGTILMAVGFPAILDATPAGFTLQVLLPEMAASNINIGLVRDPSAGIFNRLGWHVVWMGVEG